MLIRRAPASSAFSTSSLTTDAGRSITSPAAIASATSGDSIWITRRRARAWRTSRQLRPQLVELLQRFQGAQGRGIDLLQLLAQRVRGHLDRESELKLGRLERPLSLQLTEDVAGPGDHRRRQSRHRGDVDSVRAVGSSRDNAMEEANR